ncbi:MAG: hypothetical protein IJ364_09435 [Oscillospiraceae bacterium]|nr:hypothetical protein [Oscillospiraceae bacterium]
MYDFSVPMALVDYIPVLFFGIAAVLLQRDLYNKMYKGAYALFAAGTINIFAAGFLKATWKLLYAAGICDFQALNLMFLPVQSLGFLLAGLGLVGMFCWKRQTAALAVAPPVFSGSFVFIMMMVLGLGAICTVLSIVAVKMKKKWAVLMFVLAFVCSMGMGYMSSHDSTSALVNWIEQGINCVGQAMLLGGTLVLHKAGLAEVDWKK